jgi:BON domain
MNETGLLKNLMAAFERDRRINLHRDRIDCSFSEGGLLLQGEVGTLAAKVRAARLAYEHADVPVVDRLRVTPAQPWGDGAIRAALVESLLAEPVYLNCVVQVLEQGTGLKILRQPPEAEGLLEVAVNEGVISLAGPALSLSHRRLAGVLAWWTPGCRDVANDLEVVPPEEDSDDEISDALRLVLDKDLFIPAEQITLTTRQGVVTVQGLLAHAAERERAEFDSWCIDGVVDVDNRIEVRR